MKKLTIKTQQDIISIISTTNQELESWAANWSRYGRLQLLSHPKTSTEHLVSKTIREAHDGERNLKLDCWRKVNTKYPGISYTFYEDVFHDLLQQIYFNLKSDLFCARL